MKEFCPNTQKWGLVLPGSLGTQLSSPLPAGVPQGPPTLRQLHFCRGIWTVPPGEPLPAHASGQWCLMAPRQMTVNPKPSHSLTPDSHAGARGPSQGSNPGSLSTLPVALPAGLRRTAHLGKTMAAVGDVGFKVVEGLTHGSDCMEIPRFTLIRRDL